MNASNFDEKGLTFAEASNACSDCAQWSKTLFALARSSRPRATGIATASDAGADPLQPVRCWCTAFWLPLNTAAPSGVLQIASVSAGHLISSEPSPQTTSKRGLYSARESRYAMQAGSGKPCSSGSTGGCCACSAFGLLNLYPVERESQKFPPKKAFRTPLYSSWGK